MSETPLCMVRNGVSLGLDMTPKFLWASFGMLASLERFRKKQRLDYIFVYGLAGSVWTYLEWKLLNARKATKHNPKLFKLITLSPFITTLIRGYAEGGSFTLLGLMMGDKKYSNKWLKSMLILLFGTTFLVSPYLHKNKPERISSVRQIFKDGQSVNHIIFWTLMMLIGFLKLKKDKSKRLKNSFLALCVVGLLWNWFAYTIKCRWISRNKNGKEIASFYDQLLGLNYDAIFEIAAIYCGFISICLIIIQAFDTKQVQDGDESVIEP